MQQQADIKSHAQRKAALDADTHAIRERGARDLSALQKQSRAIAERVQTEITAAELRAEQTAARLAGAIALEFHAEIAPFIKEWIAEPSRKLAVTIGSTFRRFDQRVQDELGEPTWDGMLAVAFASELISDRPSAVNAFSANGWGSACVLELLGGLRKAVHTGPGHLEASLAAVESELQMVAARSADEPIEPLARRFELMKACATHREASEKLSAFDAQEEARRQEAFAGTYVPPEPLHLRVRSALGL